MEMRSWSCFVYAVLVVALASASFHGVDAQFNSVDGIYSTGLGILYTMVDQFLEVVQPSGGTTFIGAVNEYLIPDILQCFFNSSSTCNSTAQMIALDSLKMLMVVAGIATCVIFGILYIIVMCCGCCVFSCCRKCGLCGGKISKKPVQKSDKIKRPVLTVVVVAITVMIGAGLVCSLLSDVAISNLVAVDKDTNQIPIIKAATDILQSATTLIKKYINDASSLSNPLSDTVDFIFGQLTVLENELLQVIKNDSVLNTTLSGIDDLLTEARRMNDSLTTISQTTRDLQSLQRDLNATLVNISQDILSIISGCQTQDCDRLNTNAISLATATPNFSQVPDVSKALMNLQDILNNSAATNFEMKLREFTNKANETVASVKNITDQLLNSTQLIDSLLGSFGVNNIDALVAPYIEFLNNTTPFFSEPKAGPFTISQLVLLILAGYGITILLVIICNLGGILTGLCCKRPISKTKGSCSSKKASETFFKCSTTCSFSAGSLTMVFVVILFAITVPFYIELCRDRENYNSTRYKDLDNLTHVLINYFDETGKIPETLNVGNVTINISLILSRLYVATLVRECQNNQSILTMAIDLLTVDELYRIANQIVDEKVNPLLEDLRDTLNVTLSGLVDTLISNSTLKSLDDAVSSIPDKSNFSSVIDQFWNVSQLNSTLQNTADMADNVSSHPSTAGLQEQAERLRSASVTYVTPIVQKTDQLNKSLEELSNSAIKSQINATLRSLETAKNYISSNKSQLIDSILTLVKHFIKEKVPEVIDFAIQDLSAFFGCRYLYNLIDGIFNLICDPLQPIMALWFSYGWCLFFFIPSIIFGLWLGGLNARQLDPPSSEKKKGAPPSHEKGREGPETYNSRTEGPDSQTYFDRGPRGMPPPGYPGPYGRSLRPLSQQYEMPPPGYPGPYGRSLWPLSQQYEMPPPGYPGPYGRSLWPLSQQYEMPPPGYPGPYGRSSRPLSQQYKIPPPGYPGPNGRGFGSLPQYDMPPLGYPSLYARGFMSLPQQYDIGLRSLRPSESMNPYERVLRPEPLTDLRIYPSSLRPLATSNPSPYQKTPTKLPPVIIYSPLPRPPEPPPLRPITLAYPLNYFPGSMFGPIRPIQSRIYPN